jgi:hypothetical protein
MHFDPSGTGFDGIPELDLLSLDLTCNVSPIYTCCAYFTRGENGSSLGTVCGKIEMVDRWCYRFAVDLLNPLGEIER